MLKEDQLIPKTDLSLKEIILKGNQHYYKKEFDEVLKWYDKAIEIEPNNYDLWLNKGNSLSELGKHKEAIECLDKAIKRNPL